MTFRCRDVSRMWTVSYTHLKLGKKLFLLFCWLFCILVVAAFADVVAGTFNGFVDDDAGTVSKVAANGAVAPPSMLFIVEAVALGCILKYAKLNKWVNTAIAIVMLVAAVALGLYFPMYLTRETWHILIFIYILIASVAPVTMLLQPRDYLNSYLPVSYTHLEYQAGELINKSKVADLDYDGIESAKRGVIAVIPDFELFRVKLIIADDYSKCSTDFPILEN